MLTVKEFQVLLSNANNSIQQYSFVCTHLNGSKYCNVLLTIQLNICYFPDSSISNNSIYCKFTE